MYVKRNSICIINKTVLQNITLYPFAKGLLRQFNGNQIRYRLFISGSVAGIDGQSFLITLADALFSGYKAFGHNHFSGYDVPPFHINIK